LTQGAVGATLETNHDHTPLKRDRTQLRLIAAAGIQWRTSMAKALLGHLGGPDPRMLSEMRRLQQRVRDLESECLRLQAANDELHAEAAHDDLLTLSVPEPEPAFS